MSAVVSGSRESSGESRRQRAHGCYFGYCRRAERALRSIAARYVQIGTESTDVKLKHFDRKKTRVKPQVFTWPVFPKRDRLQLK